jgi:hypothetical protein
VHLATHALASLVCRHGRRDEELEGDVLTDSAIAGGVHDRRAAASELAADLESTGEQGA